MVHSRLRKSRSKLMAQRPNRFRSPVSQRSRRKWRLIIDAFTEDRLEELRSIQRSGARGRIFSVLVNTMLGMLRIGFQPEPIFDHVVPNPWYVDFAAKHGLKLRTHAFYNPDFLLEDGRWLEVTLSENEA